jgi:N-acetylmuramoyl-L-alanine amidase
LQSRYRIPVANFLGHGDIAPRRKVDPGRHFPWQRLAQHGFGLWCEAPNAAEPTPATDPLLLLQAIGYDTNDPDAALSAFRRHFLASESNGAITEPEWQIIACLARKKRNRPE